MKQRIAAAMLITLMPISLAACGGEKANSSSATPSSESSSAATQNTAPAGNQSKEDACKEIEKAMADASETVMSATSEISTDTASIKNAFDSIADAYATASEKISNEDIKKSVDQVTADWLNAGEKAAAISTTNGSGLNEYTQAVNDVSTHQNELFATCGLMSTSN